MQIGYVFMAAIVGITARQVVKLSDIRQVTLSAIADLRTGECYVRCVT
jgi:hypothetical protein